MQRIQTALKTVTGQEWTIRIEKEAGEAETSQPKSAQVIAQQGLTNRTRNEEAKKIPLIGRAIDKLGARMLKIDDDFGSESTPAPEIEPAEPQEN